jgi:cellulase/cellobiase CelA1
MTGSWPDGYGVTVTVRNDGDETVTGWTVRWNMPPGHTIRDLWNGEDEQDGTAVTVRNADWNVTVEPGASTTFGFNANATDAQRTDPDLSCVAG